MGSLTNSCTPVLDEDIIDEDVDDEAKDEDSKRHDHKPGKQRVFQKPLFRAF